MSEKKQDAQDLLDAQVGSLKGNPRRVSKEEIWRELAKQTIDLK